MPRNLRLLLTFLLTLPALQVVGQGPKPRPPVGVESAKKIAAGALAKARKNNWFMAVAVVDPSGTLIYYEKMDNTQTGSADAPSFRRNTGTAF